jgi:signal transduction histidine kinase
MPGMSIKALIQRISGTFSLTPLLNSATCNRYGAMRWLTFGAITLVCAFSLHGNEVLPGLPLLVGLIVAYVALVRWQYGSTACPSGELRINPERYSLLSALLIFAMASVPLTATGGQSLWYNVMYFGLLSEGRNLATTWALWRLLGLCVVLVHTAVFIAVPNSDWFQVSGQFLPLDVGLAVSATRARLQRIQEEEHAARLVLLEELERSKARLEDANYQLQVYAGTVEQLAVANERNRLARDLHDILGYTLATVVVKAEAAKRLLAADLDRAREELDRVQEVARSGLAEVRQSVAGLRDATAAASVWHEAMARFIQDFSRETGLPVTQRIMPLPETHDSAIEVCLFRVIQEALTNVARHAQASRVSVTLQIEGNQATLSIEDNGVGAGPSDSIPAGFGVRGMRERVEQLGGRLVFSSKRGEGTRVVATIPCCGGHTDPNDVRGSLRAATPEPMVGGDRHADNGSTPIGAGRASAAMAAAQPGQGREE